MIHYLFVLLYLVYKIENWHTIVCCDNQGVVNMSAKKTSKNPPRLKLCSHFKEHEKKNKEQDK